MIVILVIVSNCQMVLVTGMLTKRI